MDLPWLIDTSHWKGWQMSSASWIEFEGRKYSVAPGERALDAMLRQGAPITFSCRKGTCRSCMLQATSGEPGPEAVARLPQDLREAGFFLPCCATEVDSVRAQRPDLSLCVQTAVVAETILAAPDILRLRLEPTSEFDWTPGQVVGLINPAGDARSYSIVSRKDDYYLEINLRLLPNGSVSGWAARLQVGDEVRLHAPSGEMIWREDLADRPLLLIATGCGGGVLAGIARDALARGHRGPVRLFHGGRSASDLYLAPFLADLLSDRVQIVQATSTEAVDGHPAMRITDVAFAEPQDLSGTAIFLCGNPDMVETARIKAIQAGADLALIFTDPFVSPIPYRTTENYKLSSIQPDPELWLALQEGALLKTILTEFYTQVYQDPRISPFFHRATKQRSIEKQYSFLQDLFSGTKLYFGEKPFNAHHWMIISDDLFDYREKLFFDIVRRHDIAEPMIHRWAAIHEMFRREIVKSVPRGLLRNGEEVDLEGYAHETIDVGAVCDGCQQAIEPGEKVLMHTRTGEIFCERCEGRRSGKAA